MKSIFIEKNEIGKNSPPFVIAEMSGNHKKSLDRALEIVEAAAEAGAHALKLQTYTADTMTLNIREREFFIDNNKNIWQGKSLYELYDEAHTPWDWHAPIFNRANELGVICFSTPFDDTAVDFLEDLNVPAYKVASFEITHLPLIEKIALTGKPVIISTGMASLSEIDQVVKIFKDNDNEDYILLKCTSTYPATPENSNVLTIPHMRKLFNCQVGLSDHTMGLGTSIAAVSQGATVIEKHFTLDRKDGGVDSSFSMEPSEMMQLVLETERAWQSLGKIKYGPSEMEKDSLTYRRSLYIAEDMKKNDILTKDNLGIIRPGLGLPPKYYEILLGRRVNRNLKKGTPLSFDHIK